MPRKSSRNQPPDWLWFFIALPASLITVLILRRHGKLPAVKLPPVKLPVNVNLPIARRARYVEPDSIPLDMADARSEAVRSEAAAPRGAGQAEIEDTFDDLKVIEGIGPSIAGLLRENGIRTYQALADAPFERLKKILAEARLSHLADPTTWGDQARLAGKGAWDELDELQKTLKGGRKTG